jgi:hypothetical protein
MKKDTSGKTQQKKDSATQQLEWWNNLTDAWKMAFNETLFKNKTTDTPTTEQLQSIWDLTILRMAGPTAVFPNMSFELDDLSGLRELANLEILVVVNQNLESFEEIAGLTSLNSLFLFSNRIKVLRGVEKLHGLKKLYINDNFVTTLQALSNLTNLESLHCANNKITSLKGIGKQHKELKEFFCIPNEGIWQSEIIRFETETHIRCLKG